MKNNHMKTQFGFTLLEIIVVIAIIAILAAIVVPRFYDFTEKSEVASEESVIGNFKSGLNLYSFDRIMEEGRRKFPCAQWAVFDLVLDEIPDNWEYQPASPPTYYGTLVHTRSDSVIKTWRYFTTGGRTKYEVQDATYTPPPPPQSGPGGVDITCN